MGLYTAIFMRERRKYTVVNVKIFKLKIVRDKKCAE
jgi:hypothetical protein